MIIETYPLGRLAQIKETKEKGLILSKRLDLIKGYSVLEGEYTVLCKDSMYLKSKDELDFIPEEKENKELKIFLLELLLCRQI